MDYPQAASGGEFALRAAIGVSPAPQQPLTLSVLDRLNEASKRADQIGYSLSSVRDRLWGPQPELASSGNSGAEPVALEPQIAGRLEYLISQLARLDALAEQINSRL